MDLICHTQSPPAHVRSVTCRLRREGRRVSLEYRVVPFQSLVLPPQASPSRTDDLWQATCFELFVKPEGGAGYAECNFSPSTAWAAYAFDGYRKRRRDLPMPPPRIARRSDGVDVTVDIGDWLDVPVRIGLNAVIEEVGGVKSYWALDHGPDKPDFHHERCFALRLPAAS